MSSCFLLDCLVVPHGKKGMVSSRGHKNKLDAYKAKYKILPRSFVVEEDQFEIATDTMSES